jgi:hypothetical protein
MCDPTGFPVSTSVCSKLRHDSWFVLVVQSIKPAQLARDQGKGGAPASAFPRGHKYTEKAALAPCSCWQHTRGASLQSCGRR